MNKTSVLGGVVLVPRLQTDSSLMTTNHGIINSILIPFYRQLRQNDLSSRVDGIFSLIEKNDTCPILLSNRHLIPIASDIYRI